MSKLRIGVTTNIVINTTGYFAGENRVNVSRDYVLSLEKAGAAVVLLPVMQDEETIEAQLQCLDGVILCGGADIDPSLYGESVHMHCGPLIPEVDAYYMKVIKLAEKLQLPVFGICKGVQAINVAYGGTLYQDLATERPGSYQHSQQTFRDCPTHSVTIEKDSFLYPVLTETCRVNSFHHQAIKDVAPCLKVIARSEEGIVEGVQKTEGNFVAGVQFHPEMMAQSGNETMIRLFKAFLEQCQL